MFYDTKKLGREGKNQEHGKPGRERLMALFQYVPRKT
jgi:hypothetical protein